VVRLIAQAYSFPKDPGAPKEWEDAAAYSVRSGRFAVADGASQAYRSGEWAELLVRAYITSFPASAMPLSPEGGGAGLAREQVIREWFGDQVRLWHDDASQAKNWWGRDAEASQPPSATFVGLQFTAGTAAGLSWEACAFGDCCLFQIRGGLLTLSFPLSSKEQFTKRPDLITTAHGRLQGSLATLRTRTGRALPGDIFVLASDALSERLLDLSECEPSRLGRVGFFGSGQFATLMTELREADAIETDDVAMVVVAVCR
jgi:Protein phosphatase 2C